MPVRRRCWRVGAAGVGNTHRAPRASQRRRKDRDGKQEVSVGVRNMKPKEGPALQSHDSHLPLRPALQATHDSHLPLRVNLPPEKVATSTTKVLTLDQGDTANKGENAESTDDNKTLNVEEFECGVSLAGSDRQEWSFTLYDFDGNGKITKEDLGSLLRSLYDAVGSSINLPKSGTKTLKLRLTVSPDHSKVSQPPNKKENAKEKNDFQKESNTKTAKENKLNKDLDNSKLSSKKELKLDNISKAEQLNLEVTPQDGVKVHHKEVKNNLSLPCKTTRKPKLSSIEQRHLAELIQKNMERHQQRQKQRPHQTRKHRSDHWNHPCSAANNHQNMCEESQDRRNYYLDLAGVENEDSKLCNLSAPVRVLSPRLVPKDHGHQSWEPKLRCRSHTTNSAQPAQRQHNHRRSKSHDANKRNKAETAAVEATAEQTRYIELTAEADMEKVHSAKSPSKREPSPNKNHKTRPVSLPPNVPDTASPHHHRRHRNREKNRKLAMQQVAEWIEREHSWSGDREQVQRHEHHHIHEHHHHHHYHHYHET